MGFLNVDKGQNKPLESSIPQPSSAERLPLNRRQRSVVLLAAAASSACGLAVELLLGGLTSYLVGDHALAYGVALGGFLAAMGVGSYLSQFVAVSYKNSNNPTIAQDLIRAFIQVELAMAPAIALVPLGLFALFVAGGWLWLGLALSTLFLGILAGMEVPLLTRLLERDS